VSKNSAAGMEVRPGPCSRADVELEALEGVLESFALTLLLACGGILCREPLKVIADHASERGVAVHGDFA